MLANRYDASAYTVQGSITFSGQFNKDIGYVTQQDYLLPFLTVKETVLFAAQLRIAQSDDRLRHKTYDDIADDIILDLGLRECANSCIGDDMSSGVGVRGISGGEKRRVSIATQIVRDPRVLCADEPTSGLDAFTAITVIETLRRLSAGPHATTIVCSIHQPRADIFNMFSGVLLLSKGGHPIYCGDVNSMHQYFASLGYDCPVNSNPADYFVDVSSVDPRSGDMDRSEAKARIRRLITAYASTPAVYRGDSGANETMLVAQTTLNIVRCSQFTQIRLLTQRFVLNNYRSQGNITGGLMQAIIIGFVIMGLFWNLSDSLSDIESRNGLMYLCISMESYILMIILVERFCTETKVLDRELQDNLYDSSSFLIAHILSSAPQLIVQPIFYALPIYIGCNLRHGAEHACIFLAVSVLLSFVVNGLTWWCVSIHRSFTVASLVANTNFTFISLAAGFLVNLNELPSYIYWVKKISFLNYAYRILMSNEFSDRTFDGCASDVPEECSQYNGNDILGTQDVPINDYKSSVWFVLIAIGAAYYALAFLLLEFVRFPVTGTVGVGSLEEDDEMQEENENPIQDVEKTGNQLTAPLLTHEHDHIPITVRVSNVTLFVPKSRYTADVTDVASENVCPFPTHSKCILRDISATFRPRRLVALMGGSGSGKTTLLNLIGGRISRLYLSRRHRVDAQSKYAGSGVITFNDKICTNHDVRHAIGYVQQFDFHYPLLTVLETLLFHVSIRFPRATEQQKRVRVAYVLDLLGLRACAQTRVGGDDVKGVSGGEKRRLSIGVQLLVDPAVCLLDEPTTSLDAFTARHVVETLQHLAHTGGRTVIISIHQPRYDVFALLDDVVLLSRGEQVWAGSSSDMLRHFESLGFSCPALVNPADFILDVSSVDFRSADAESASKERRKVLVSAYDKLKENASCLEIVENVTSEEVETEVCGLWQSLMLLCSRSGTNMFRHPVLSTTRISQGLFFALILCAFYTPIGDNQNSIQNRIGLLYELTALCFIGMLNCIAIFPQERNVFYREYADGGYSATSFFLSYFIIGIPFILASALAFSVLMTSVIGLQPTLEAFVVLTYVLFCFMFVGECIGVMFCAAFHHVGFSVNIMSIVIGVANQFTGFVSLSIPTTFNYLGYVSPLKWGSIVAANVAFRGESFTCSSDEKDINGDCPLESGSDVLKLYDMDYSNSSYDNASFYMWVLGGTTLAFFIGAYVVFEWRAYTLRK